MLSVETEGAIGFVVVAELLLRAAMPVMTDPASARVSRMRFSMVLGFLRSRGARAAGTSGGRGDHEGGRYRPRRRGHPSADKPTVARVSHPARRWRDRSAPAGAESARR